MPKSQNRVEGDFCNKHGGAIRINWTMHPTWQWEKIPTATLIHPQVATFILEGFFFSNCEGTHESQPEEIDSKHVQYDTSVEMANDDGVRMGFQEGWCKVNEHWATRINWHKNENGCREMTFIQSSRARCDMKRTNQQKWHKPINEA